MKNKVFLLFGFVALVSVFAWQSCEMVKVDSPEISETEEYTPVYYVKGVITSADNETGVANATVTIGDVTVTTGADGSYSYETENAFEAQTVVKVEAEGFVQSTSALIYGDKAPIEYFLDFTLTRELPASMVNLAAGGEISFDGGKVIVPSNNSVTLDGSTLENIEISVTPISPFSTLGNWVGASLKKLKFEPAGAEFEKPVTIVFDIPADADFSEINLYAFDNMSNIWNDMDATIEIENEQMTFELKFIPFGLHVVNPASINITSNFVAVEAPNRYSPNTCDCEVPFSWSGGNYLRQIEFISGTGSINELNSLHFFSNYGIPYIPGLIIGVPVAPLVPITAAVYVPACKQVDIDSERQYREISGTYDYEGETGKTFTIRYYFGVNVTVNDPVDCSVYTQCHQGCGN